jgi:methionyl-tRNA formyltransferase
MAALRIIFMGTAELSCASLEKLAGQASSLSNDGQDARPTFSVAAVVTPPDKPKGRDLKLQPSPVKSLAFRLNLPVLQPVRARDEAFIGELRALRPDLIVVVAYGHILPPAILELPRHGCLNVHTSLLPKFRGAAPIQWAIATGETETGVTVMKMDAGLDTGPIVSRRRTPILPADDSATLHDRLAQLGAELLVQTIPDFVAGKIQPVPQPAVGVSHAPKIKKEDGRIDWNQSAETIWNRLRAFTPWPGAFTFWLGVPPSGGNGIRIGGPPEGGTPNKPLLLKIWKAEPVEQSGRMGEILSADKNGIAVACGKNTLRILELQRESGKRLTAAQFLAGHPLMAGDRFEG